MRKFLSAAVAAFALSACAALEPPHGDPPPPAPPTLAPAPEGEMTHEALVARGRGVAEVFCVSCHAIGTTGESPLDAAPPFRTLAESYPVNALEEAFAEGVLVGHPAMPEFQFQPQDIDALVAYLQSIQTRRAG